MEVINGTGEHKEILREKGSFEEIDNVFEDTQRLVAISRVANPEDPETIKRYTGLVDAIGLIRDDLRVQHMQIKNGEEPLPSEPSISEEGAASSFSPKSELAYPLKPSLEGGYYFELSDVVRSFGMPSNPYRPARIPNREPIFAPEEWQQEVVDIEGVPHIRVSKNIPTKIEGLTGTYTILITQEQNALRGPFETYSGKYPGKLTFQYNETIRKKAAAEPDLPPKSPNPPIKLLQGRVRTR